MVQLIKALRAKQAGPLSEVLYIDEIPKPTPGEGQVLIRVRATAVNPLDWKQAQHGLFVQSWPHPLGYDISGVVEEVGAGVAGIAVGDEVYSGTTGGFAEYNLAPASKVYKKPASLSFEEATTIPVGVATAVAALFTEKGLGLHQLKEAHNFETPEWVLVTGGATSVGVFAIQLAARAGYKVVVTASKKNEEYVKSLGASASIDYTLPTETQLATIKNLTSNSLRYAIDLVDGRETSDLAIAALNHSLNPTLINLAYFGPQDVPEGVNARGLSGGDPSIQDEVRKIRVEQVVPLLESGELKVNKVHRLEGGLEGLKEGLKISAEGRVSGAKLVASL
ncbi:hypothetical protein HK097_010948 [Rhizophlyctis rosea]|uniref:Enoyl reductase (ER) domain-containing protein n=1 Tax=Rhizophlyctis rosea TaxID=64517 RepID=A0AAD5SIN6_9FUNG|nr:hypothetical protein HK097_010948 [Rhizophlyctis rosea]